MALGNLGQEGAPLDQAQLGLGIGSGLQGILNGYMAYKQLEHQQLMDTMARNQMSAGTGIDMGTPMSANDLNYFRDMIVKQAQLNRFKEATGAADEYQKLRNQQALGAQVGINGQLPDFVTAAMGGIPSGASQTQQAQPQQAQTSQARVPGLSSVPGGGGFNSPVPIKGSPGQYQSVTMDDKGNLAMKPMGDTVNGDYLNNQYGTKGYFPSGAVPKAVADSKIADLEKSRSKFQDENEQAQGAINFLGQMRGQFQNIDHNRVSALFKSAGGKATKDFMADPDVASWDKAREALMSNYKGVAGAAGARLPWPELQNLQNLIPNSWDAPDVANRKFGQIENLINAGRLNNSILGNMPGYQYHMKDSPNSSIPREFVDSVAGKAIYSPKLQQFVVPIIKPDGTKVYSTIPSH